MKTMVNVYLKRDGRVSWTKGGSGLRTHLSYEPNRILQERPNQTACHRMKAR